MSYQFPMPPQEAWQKIVGDKADEYMQRLLDLTKNTISMDEIIIRVFWMWYSKNVEYYNVEAAIDLYKIALALHTDSGINPIRAVARFCALLEERHNPEFATGRSNYVAEFGLDINEVIALAASFEDKDGCTKEAALKNAIVDIANANMMLQHNYE